MAQISWRLLELPHDSSSLKGSVYFATRGKKDRQIVWDYFAVWPIFCRWFGYSFALVWKIDDASHTCEGSCTLYPNFENFCPTNSQFFSIGDATASPCLHYDDMNWLPFSLSPTTSHTRSCAELTPRRVINYPLFDAIHGKNQTSQKSNPCVCPKFPINTIL